MGINLKRYAKPSKYIRATDIGDGTLVLTVADVKEASIGRYGDPAVLLSFAEDTRQLSLNASRLRAMISAYGDNTDDWAGNAVELFTEQTDMGPGIRIRPTNRPRVNTLPPKPQGGGGDFGSPGPLSGALDDEIPF
jgi:hypothetical protein